MPPEEMTSTPAASDIATPEAAAEPAVVEPEVGSDATAEPEAPPTEGAAKDGEPADAPEGSSPQQQSNWARLRTRAETAESERDDLRAKYEALQDFEPARDEIFRVLDALTTLEPDTEGRLSSADVAKLDAAIGGLSALDSVGTSYLAGHLISHFAPHFFGASVAEIQAALAAPRQASAPTGAPGGMDAAFEEELEFLDSTNPELAAYLRSLRTSEPPEPEPEPAEPHAAAPELENQRSAEFFATMRPAVEAKLTELGIEIDGPRGRAVLREMSESIERNPHDLETVERARRLHVAGRKFAVQKNTKATESVLVRHAALAAHALYGAKADAAAPPPAKPATPAHVPGSAAQAPGRGDTSLSDRVKEIYRKAGK